MKDCPTNKPNNKTAHSLEAEPEEEATGTGNEFNGLFINAFEFKADYSRCSCCAIEHAEPGKERESCEKLKMGVDSCAGVTAVPSSRFGGYPQHATRESRLGVGYKTANNQEVPDKGAKHLVGYVKGTEGMRAFKARSADVSRGLMCVAELVDAGHRIIFEKKGGMDVSRAENTENGEASLPSG